MSEHETEARIALREASANPAQVMWLLPYVTDAIAAAEERGRRAGIEERDMLLALLKQAREVVRWGVDGGVACLGNRPAAAKLLAHIDSALAPRDSGKGDHG